MIAWLTATWLTRVALAQTCDLAGLPTPSSPVSVAWVSKLGAHARNTEWLYVVPTADLRAFVDGDGKHDIVRTLQWLGLRRKERPPHRRYKIVIFDTEPDQICRPVESGEAAIAGVRPCDAHHAGAHGTYGGCGWLTDLGTGRASSVVYRAQWQSLAADGFCVLPLERFLSPDR